jgi:hypothetical protein
MRNHLGDGAPPPADHTSKPLPVESPGVEGQKVFAKNPPGDYNSLDVRKRAIPKP